MRDVALGDRRRIHGRGAGGEGDLRPVDAVGEHELLADDLAHGEEVLTEVEELVDRGREDDCRDGEAVIFLSRSVVHNPEVRVDLEVGVGRLTGGEEQAEASAGVHRVLLTHAVARALEVDLEELVFFFLLAISPLPSGISHSSVNIPIHSPYSAETGLPAPPRYTHP